MELPSLTTLSALLLASEVALALAKRSKSLTTGKDRLTLPLLWTVITVSIFVAFFLRAAFPQGRLPHAQTFYIIGLILFALGLIIRWIAIIHLGRFFTVNVAIAHDHQLITTGPYRFVRHPSYTGTLLIFLGFGLCMPQTCIISVGCSSSSLASITSRFISAMSFGCAFPCR